LRKTCLAVAALSAVTAIFFEAVRRLDGDGLPFTGTLLFAEKTEYILM
jgi:hypothetical protein